MIIRQTMRYLFCFKECGWHCGTSVAVTLPNAHSHDVGPENLHELSKLFVLFSIASRVLVGLVGQFIEAGVGAHAIAKGNWISDPHVHAGEYLGYVDNAVGF